MILLTQGHLCILRTHAPAADGESCMSTILVVDDMAIFRDPITICLRSEGYQTLSAGDGRAALALLKAKAPDLIILDLAMPTMDGITFLKHLRNDPIWAKLPVILLTAVFNKQLVVEVAKLGVRDYLLKSKVSLADLLERIRKTLNLPAPPATCPQPDPAVKPAEPKAQAA